MPNLVDVTVPVGQAEGTESVVSTWFKSVGDAVTENEPLLEISTDKVNMEVASPGTGRLAEIIKNDGDQVEPGEVLGRIDLDGEGAPSAPAAPPPPATAQADGTEKAAASQDLSPAVRKLLKEHKLDAAQITGTGKGGRITAEDVLKHVETQSTSGHARGTQTPGAGVRGHRVAHTQMRRCIAQHMVQ